MANRYCNLVGSKKISEDFQNINIGFDAVQKDMDSKSSGDHRHPNATDTTDGFMSAQDKAKMDASTAAATPGTLAQRDASGRMKAAAPSAKSDVARKAEVDAVQADLDTHKDDAVMHVTAEDHEKIASIEEGAEVNQNAFSKVNDIEASEKTDALNIKGGVGIKISTNPTTNEVTITASGESTPGAHGSSHTEHGSDPIPNATAKEGGLMSAADKAEFGTLAPEVPKHSKQLKEHAAELEDHEQRIVDMETGLADVPGAPLDLQPGLQIVESDHGAPFRVGEVKGRTLINLLGKVGDCENTADWGAPGPSKLALSTDRVYGSYSIEATGANASGGFGLRSNGTIKDLNKYYIAVGHVRNISAQSVALTIADVADNFTTRFKSSESVTANQFEYVFVTVTPEELAGKERVEIYVRGVASEAGQKIAADGIGLYEITEAEYNAIEGMTPEQVAARYPYVDSMTNVTNPYAIVTGGNLLPPFYEWDAINEKGLVEDVYTYRQTEFSSAGWTQTTVPVLSNTDYFLSFIGTNGVKMRVISGDESELLLADTTAGGMFNSGANSTIRVYIHAGVSGTISNPTLVPGTEPKPFVPQQRSMLAFETELAAHPVDGSNPDTLFMGDDGLPYVLEKWKKVTLDGSLDWKRNARLSGYKELYVDLPEDSIGAGTAYITKYNGSLLEVKYPTTAGDQYYGMGSAAPKRLFFSVSNADSGWGLEYNPEPEEIKAYLDGHRMYQEGSRETPFTSGKKQWFKINKPGDPSVADTPTTSYPEWTPYRLQYLKAKPTVEPVRNYELGATLTAGSNMVEVGSGIVIRERAHVSEGATSWAINNKNLPTSILKHRTDKILSVFNGTQSDKRWNILRDEANAYGNSLAYILKSDGTYTEGLYHVTYTMLDPTLAASISGTVAVNLRGTVSDLVQDVGDVQRRLSVVENSKAETVEDTGWILVTPLSGWNHLAANPLHFRIIGNRLLLHGTIQNGTTETSTTLFTLPIIHPSKYFSYFGAVTWEGAQSVKTINCILGSGGIVRINAGTAFRFIAFDGLEWLIDGLAVKKS